METISHSVLTFLLNSLWQIALVTAVAMLICWFLRNGPAAHRHMVWVAALVVSLVLPLASLGTVEQSERLVIPRSAFENAPGADVPRTA